MHVLLIFSPFCFKFCLFEILVGEFPNHTSPYKPIQSLAPPFFFRTYHFITPSMPTALFSDDQFFPINVSVLKTF